VAATFEDLRSEAEEALAFHIEEMREDGKEGNADRFQLNEIRSI
jgi:predicted RNase H-like HicB family nuclease